MQHVPYCRRMQDVSHSDAFGCVTSGVAGTDRLLLTLCCLQRRTHITKIKRITKKCSVVHCPLHPLQSSVFFNKIFVHACPVGYTIGYTVRHHTTQNQILHRCERELEHHLSIHTYNTILLCGAAARFCFYLKTHTL